MELNRSTYIINLDPVTWTGTNQHLSSMWWIGFKSSSVDGSPMSNSAAAANRVATQVARVKPLMISTDPMSALVFPLKRCQNNPP